jgi:BMFP domain-containing protein YqiC
MAAFDNIFQKIKNIAPTVAQEFAIQSREIQQQIIDMIAEHADFVSKADFDKQKNMYQRLLQRCEALEQKYQQQNHSSKKDETI